MSVLVTGATGFIGGRYVHSLAAAGVPVVSVGRLAVNSIDLEDGFSVPHSSASTAAEISAVMRSHGVTTVVHCATKYVAQHVTSGIAEMIDANIRFGTELAEAAANTGVGFITMGSYWQFVNGVRGESTSLYAATKNAFDGILDYYAAVRAIEPLTLVLYDVYGEDDPRSKILTLLVRAALGGQPIELSSGYQLINVTYIDDVIDAIEHVRVGGCGASLRLASVRAPEFLTIRQLCSAVEDVTGLPIDARWGARSDRPNEMMDPWLVDPVLPKWEPRIPLSEGVARLATSMRSGA